MGETVTVCGYSPYLFQEEVDVTLHINGRPPEQGGPNWEREWRDWIDDQAETIMDTVMNNVSQAVSFQVLIRLMQKHTTLYAGK